MEFISTTEQWLIAGYVFFVQGLNVVAFLVSAFYQKKFDRASPYLGFLLSHLLGAIFIGTLFVADSGVGVYISVVRATTLIGCSMSTTLSVAGLFMSMRTTE